MLSQLESVRQQSIHSVGAFSWQLLQTHCKLLFGEIVLRPPLHLSPGLHLCPLQLSSKLPWLQLLWFIGAKPGGWDPLGAFLGKHYGSKQLLNRVLEAVVHYHTIKELAVLHLD